MGPSARQTHQQKKWWAYQPPGPSHQAMSSLSHAVCSSARSPGCGARGGEVAGSDRSPAWLVRKAAESVLTNEYILRHWDIARDRFLHLENWAVSSRFVWTEGRGRHKGAFDRFKLPLVIDLHAQSLAPEVVSDKGRNWCNLIAGQSRVSCQHRGKRWFAGFRCVNRISSGRLPTHVTRFDKKLRISSFLELVVALLSLNHWRYQPDTVSALKTIYGKNTVTFHNIHKNTKVQLFALIDIPHSLVTNNIETNLETMLFQPHHSFCCINVVCLLEYYYQFSH